MCNIRRRTPLPTSKIYGSVKMTREVFLAALYPYNVRPISLGDPLDSFFYATPMSELYRIAPKLVYPADWYTDELWDCDDYGLQAMLDGSRLGAGVRLCLGDTEYGYHGFAMALDTNHDLWLLEPNAGFPWAGEWFKPYENGYTPRKVLA